MRLLDGCVATAASNATGLACKLLQGSFCSASVDACSRRNCRQPHIEVHTLGSNQLGPQRAKLLWTRAWQFSHFWLANQGCRTLPQQFFAFLHTVWCLQLYRVPSGSTKT